MAEKKIYSDRPDIKKQVYEAYPILPKEKRCASFKAKREALRFERAKRLYEEPMLFISNEGENHMSLDTYKSMYITK